MRIYILPTFLSLRPEKQYLDWPPDCGGYGVEQDFLEWLWNSDHVTPDARDADWYAFLPFWNRSYMNANGNSPALRRALQDNIDKVVRHPERTFTICEYDPLALHRGLDLKSMAIFTANRCHEYADPLRVFDIPLLLRPHDLPERKPEYLTCFVGHPSTHTLRTAMFQEFGGREDCYVRGDSHDIADYLSVMRRSYTALAPRGDGAQSFRFYEAMQAGVWPIYLTDIDARPFPQFLDWSYGSNFARDATGLYAEIAGLPKDYCLDMGEEAAKMYHDHLQYGRWCRYVVRTLEML